MCNRYRGTADLDTIRATFNIKLVHDTGRLPEGGLFPKRQACVVRKEAGERVLDIMRWGFPPQAAGGAPVMNVRNLKSPFWRSALARPDRRCLVPVVEFCEWSSEKGSKTEHWFSVPSQPVFAFAGIWKPVEEERVFAFLTCEANPLVGAVHEKAMPVILHPENYDHWLDGDTDSVCSLAGAFPSQLMAMA